MQSKGICKYCGKEYTRGGMLRHLAACKTKKAVLADEKAKTKCGYFQMVISDRFDNDYWLIIEINENAKLKDLDQFLRDIWLECCGHLSGFEIGGTRYETMPDDDWFWGEPAKNMNYKVKTVLSVGDSFSYEYDYGSTTELILKVQSYRVGAKNKDNITILSRNNPPEIICSQCGINKAQWIDPEELFGEHPFWCEVCLEKAEEDTEFMLPVCNSPRMGVCGYEGSVRYDDQFAADEIKK